MEIKIQIKDRIFSICIGYKTDWFEQSNFITITEEFFNKYKEIEYAIFINHWF